MSAHTTKNATSGKATWSFYNDDDTGIDSDAANQVDIMAGGTVYATVDSTGLDVTGGVTASGDVTVGGDLELTGTLNLAGNNRATNVVTASIVSSVASATTAGAVFAIANPIGAAALVLSAYVNLGTACSSAAGTIDIGTIGASNSSADNLLDGLALSTAGLFNNVASSGTNGTAVGLTWASDAYITATVKTGDISDAVGTIYVTYVAQ